MKIYSSIFLSKLKKFHQAGLEIVLVTGVFDLFHSEHRKFLQQARRVGDVLVVGIESDLRVKAMKGSDRPIWKQEERKRKIEELGIAEVVFVLPSNFSSEDDRLKLLITVKPKFLAVSSHSPYQKEKQKLMEKIGGEVVVVHQHNPSVSTTKRILMKDKIR